MSRISEVEIIRRCREFEARWASSGEAKLENYLPSDARDEDPLFEALLHSELELLVQDGISPQESEYLSRFENAGETVRRVFSCLEDLPLVQVPEILGDFKILRRVGRGASSVVYEALQLSLNRRVALKIVVIAPLSFQSGGRADREAAAIARLQHSNIVTLHGVGFDQGLRYLVMQFVDGCSLARGLKEVQRSPSGPLNDFFSVVRDLKHSARNQQVAQLGCKLARALAYAHQNGVLHRDVKPSNIVVDQHGEVLLADFGLAKLTDPGGDWSISQSVVGTPYYIPPESFDGQWDERGDVYSLGVTLHELLTLAKPDSDTRTWLFGRKGLARLPSPRSINSRIDANLDLIVTKAVEPEPSDRYASADALADDLERFLKREPISVRPPSLFYRVSSWCRRDPALASVIAALVAVLVAAFGVSMSQSRATERVNSDLRQNVRSAMIERWDTAVKAGRHAEGLLWLDRASALQAESRVTRSRLAAADAARFQSTISELPALERIWFAVPGAQPPVLALPGGRELVIRGQTGGIRVADLYTGEDTRPEFTLPRPVERAQLSRDGRWLVIGSNMEQPYLSIVDLRNELQSSIELGSKRIRYEFTISHDSKSVAVLAYPMNGAEIRFFDVATGKEKGQRMKTSYLDPIYFSADDQFIQQFGVRTQIGRESMMRDPALRSGRIMNQIYVWAPNHTASVSVASKRGLHLFDDAAGELIGGPRFHKNWDWHERPFPNSDQIEGDDFQVVRHSPDGRYVAAGSAGGAVVLVDLESREEAASPYYHAGPVQDLQFSPCGLYVASASVDRRVEVLSLPDLRPSCPTLQHESALERIAFLEGADRLVTVTRAGVTRVWNLASAKSRSRRTVENVRYFSRADESGELFVGTADGAIQIASNGELDQLQTRVDVGAEYGQFQVSDDGKNLALLTEEEQARIWSFPSLEPTCFQLTHYAFDLGLSPDGKWLTVGHSINLNLFDWRTSVYHLESAEFRWNGRRHPSRRGIVFLPSSELAVFFALDGSVGWVGLDVRWDKRWRPEGAISVSAVAGNSVQPEVAVAFQGHGVRILETPDMKPTPFILPIEQVVALDYQPDGSRLAIGTAEGSISIVEEGSGAYSPISFRHGLGLDGLVFLPSKVLGEEESWVLASWGRDGVVRFWDPGVGRALSVPAKAAGPIRLAGQGGGYDTLLTVSENNLLSQWQLEPATLPSSRSDLAQLYASQSIESQDSMRPLSVEELKALWTRSRPVELDRQLNSKKQPERWRRNEVLRAKAQGKLAGAVYHLGHLIESNPRDPALRFQRGDLLARLEAWEAVAEDLEPLASTNSIARIELAAAHSANGAAGWEEFPWNFSLLSEGQSAILSSIRAWDEGEFERANQFVVQAWESSRVLNLSRSEEISKRNTKDSSHYWRGWIALLRLLENVMKKHPESVTLETMAGIVHSELGRWGEALNAFLRAKNSGDSLSVTACRGLIRSRFELGGRRALFEIEKTDGRLSELADLWRLRAFRLMSDGEWEEAVSAYERVVELDGNSSFVRSEIQRAQKRLGDP